MKNFNLCETSARRSRLLLKIIPLAYVMGTICYLAPAYVQWINSGTYTPSYSVYLPGLNDRELLQLVFIEIYNLVTVGTVLLTLISVDCLIYLVLINLTMISSIITSELNELEDVSKDGSANERDINRRLIKIILMHQRHNE